MCEVLGYAGASAQPCVIADDDEDGGAGAAELSWKLGEGHLVTHESPETADAAIDGRQPIPRHEPSTSVAREVEQTHALDQRHELLFAVHLASRFVGGHRGIDGERHVPTCRTAVRPRPHQRAGDQGGTRHPSQLGESGPPIRMILEGVGKGRLRPQDQIRTGDRRGFVGEPQGSLDHGVLSLGEPLFVRRDAGLDDPHGPGSRQRHRIHPVAAVQHHEEDEGGCHLDPNKRLLPTPPFPPRQCEEGVDGGEQEAQAPCSQDVGCLHDERQRCDGECQLVPR